MGHDRSLCPKFTAAMDVLDKPWNGLIILALEDGPLRFNEIAARAGAIGDRMLSLRLRELETRGLIVRSVASGPPVRVAYALTEVGRGFREVAEAMSRWGDAVLRAQSGGATATKKRRTRVAGAG
ncbi:MAG: winged helix-turn-helix transcriptional regulator [Polyangiaceae bacterium]